MLRKLSDVDSQQRVRQWGEMRLFQYCLVFFFIERTQRRVNSFVCNRLHGLAAQFSKIAASAFIVVPLLASRNRSTLARGQTRGRVFGLASSRMKSLGEQAFRLPARRFVNFRKEPSPGGRGGRMGKVTWLFYYQFEG